ncbi:DUF4390 domain-containing protein [Aquabacterium sp. OR-4]|uniref:DUF4390 domain-containing protein n=1 Tax=Aquabacterium sp. OR-4 TaxID=2978127 RepID=UPI0021B2A1DC|nr:DUF4390 domain-containing protein [Aquabacterium sp. OR-4]MDT7834089.1 DUF4390 domain-containing protein [Aquabacterium sp. OR-4]
MRRHLPPPLLPATLKRVLRWLGALLALLSLSTALHAQGVDLAGLRVKRADGELALDYQARLALTPPIEEALHRGVPLYFSAQATVYRNRWYWRDERVARVSRTWRVAYQPLTAQWRVSLGGLSQVYGTLSEALAPLSRVSGWRVADGEKLEAGERYYVDFVFRLDSSQLPPPMQVDIGNDWKLGVERTLRVD